MTAEITPHFDWGRCVRAAQSLFNDGSYPERAADALLVREGDIGEVVQVGRHVESGSVVYMVEFDGNNVIGCFESELTAGEPLGAAK